MLVSGRISIWDLFRVFFSFLPWDSSPSNHHFRENMFYFFQANKQIPVICPGMTPPQKKRKAFQVQVRGHFRRSCCFFVWGLRVWVNFKFMICLLFPRRIVFFWKGSIPISWTKTSYSYSTNQYESFRWATSWVNAAGNPKSTEALIGWCCAISKSQVAIIEFKVWWNHCPSMFAGTCTLHDIFPCWQTNNNMLISRLHCRARYTYMIYIWKWVEHITLFKCFKSDDLFTSLGINRHILRQWFWCSITETKRIVFNHSQFQWLDP